MEVRAVRNFRTNSVARVLLGLGAIVASTQGCGDETAERIRAAQLAEGCAIDSDCVDPLVCAFAHCHRECSADKDCKVVGGRCVRTPDGLGVCQLQSERDCTAAQGCVIAGEVCAEDDQCRDLCSVQNPCFPGLVC